MRVHAFKREMQKPKCDCIPAGADYAEVPPVPIPNTEVKLRSAEDTWLETTWENRWVPAFSLPFSSAKEEK